MDECEKRNNGHRECSKEHSEQKGLCSIGHSTIVRNTPSPYEYEVYVCSGSHLLYPDINTASCQTMLPSGRQLELEYSS